MDQFKSYLKSSEIFPKAIRELSHIEIIKNLRGE